MQLYESTSQDTFPWKRHVAKKWKYKHRTAKILKHVNLSKDKTPVDMNYLFCYQFGMYSQNVSVFVLRGSHVTILAVHWGVWQIT